MSSRLIVIVSVVVGLVADVTGVLIELASKGAVSLGGALNSLAIAAAISAALAVSLKKAVAEMPPNQR